MNLVKNEHDGKAQESNHDNVRLDRIDNNGNSKERY